MKRRLINEYTSRHVKIYGINYEISREIAPGVGDHAEYREIVARRWNGYRWTTVHRWTSR